MPKRKRREAEFTTQVLKYLRHFNVLGSYPFEVKVCNGNKLNYKKEIKQHQIRALSIASNNVLLYKISDMDRMSKPFDGFCFDHSDAYFIINFNYPKDKDFFMIPVGNIKEEIEKGKKSLTKKRADEISSLNGTILTGKLK